MGLFQTGLRGLFHTMSGDMGMGLGHSSSTLFGLLEVFDVKARCRTLSLWA